MKLLREISRDDLTEYFKSSIICAITLINSNVVICSMSELENEIIMFNPVIVDGFVDEAQVYQYYFKPLCVASKDSYTVVDKRNLLYVNGMDKDFLSDYAEYVKAKNAKILEEHSKKSEPDGESTPSNVVKLSKTSLH